MESVKDESLSMEVLKASASPGRGLEISRIALNISKGAVYGGDLFGFSVKTSSSFLHLNGQH